MSMDGPEMASSKPSAPNGIHMPRPRKVARMLDRKVAIPATATPIAATVPTSIFLASGGFAAASSAFALSA